MAPLTAPRIAPAGIYRIHSLLRLDHLLEQCSDGPITLAPGCPDDANNSRKWEICTFESDNVYKIRNLGTSYPLGIVSSAQRPEESFPASNRYATPVLWTIEPRHEAFVLGVHGEERVITLTSDGQGVYLSDLNGSTNQRWIFEIVSLRSPDEIDVSKTYVIRNHGTGKSLLVRSTYGTYPLHITSYLDVGKATPDYLKWKLTRDDKEGGISLKNGRFPDLWAAESFRVGDKPAGYRFIPVPGGKFYFISPGMTSSPPRVAQDGSGVGLDAPMPTAIMDPTNPFQMWELIAI